MNDETHLPLPAAGPLHNNQQLFSDYYLNRKLPERADWRALAERAEPVREKIAALFAAFTPSTVEAQVEKDWVYPVLAALGHDFEVQAPLKTPDGTKKPDYVFYRDRAAQDANKGQTLTDTLLKGSALAVGDAKYWDRPLDITIKEKGDPFNNKNPSYQIAFYVQHSGVDWGILTNGRLWRLYHRETAHKLNRYYEVDLPALLARGDAEAFLYFYAFFHRSAFEPGPLGVAALLRESSDYAQGVGNSLKRQVYAALTHLAQGFLDYAPNGLHADTETLKTIYNNSLILLYRLLFILYAEARELLPVRERDYRESYSLYALKQEVAENLDAERRLLPTSAKLWPSLRELFDIIDRGSPPLKVTTYNGGLFDPARHPFLNGCSVGDAHLQRAIDMLARIDDPATGQRVFVDYRDLSERHLGTIYEGLLEFHLEALEAPSPADGRGVPAPITSPASREAGVGTATGTPLPSAGEGKGEGASVGADFTIALVNDKGERKATGSYYTPDYIVKYIVDQTVGLVLREAVAGKATDTEKIEAVLNTNVLDPAMGSGHFLVEATEYIARFLVDLAVTPEEPSLSSSPSPRRGGGRGGRSEADIDYWKRRVAQSCVYGVDLNPLAVDLAKLSLWLSTLASDRPLSFLDHHLRVGNALVGARLADLEPGGAAGAAASRAKKKRVSREAARQEAAGQMSMLADDAFRQSMSVAVGNMWLIEESDARTVEQVKEQERLYEGLRGDFTRRYGRLADLVTAMHFGVSVEPSVWKPLADYAMGRAVTGLPKFDEWLKVADARADERRFFHWELEFPEVFFDRQGRALGEAGGFDAVIGNPPYVRQEEIAPYKPFLAREFAEVYHGVADLFVYFFGQGVRLLRHGGRTAYISSNSWLRANYAGPLRGFLRKAATVEQLVDLGDNRVFADAPDVYPAIHVVRHEPPSDEYTAQAAVFTRGEGLREFDTQVRAKLSPVSIHDQTDTGWQLGDDVGRKVFAKLMAGGKPLGEVVNGQVYRGVLTGLNEAFIIDTATRDRLVKDDSACAAIIKPILRGEDLRPWYQENEGRWVIALPCGWTSTQFGPDIAEWKAWEKLQELHPALAAYLAPFEQPARNRGDKGEYWWELRACAYYDAFEKPKIFWPDIGKFPRFSWNENGAYVNDKGFIAVPKDAYVLGVLQSRPTWLCISQLCVPLGERAGSIRYQQKSQFISRLPIPDAPDADREAIGGLAMAITEQARARYALHQKTRRRILSDLGADGKTLNQKLTAWWDLTFPAFRAELQKVFRRDIAVKERDDWEEWLAAQRAEHAQRTAEIVRLETDLNARVYALFDLSPDEIRTIEESTRYQYGAV